MSETIRPKSITPELTIQKELKTSLIRFSYRKNTALENLFLSHLSNENLLIVKLFFTFSTNITVRMH
jgi:hypothetical protein